MRRYVVVTRDSCQPIERYVTIDGAADRIVRDVRFDRWTVLAQEGNKITSATPYRKLTPHERKSLEAKLYPTLFQ